MVSLLCEDSYGKLLLVSELAEWKGIMRVSLLWMVEAETAKIPILRL
jgi:hypothetical protein